ncbi:MAG TPA: DUF1997 domain-containing protein [Chroococcidiopsis sp.]
MQANPAEHSSLDSSNSIFSIASNTLLHSDESAGDESGHATSELTYFRGHYDSSMEMFAPAQAVAEYLDGHREWFTRCARPMKTTPIGENGYALTIGRFGSYGYEVEPKIGLDLLPQDKGVYRIRTIALPENEGAGYEVDFQAALQLVETDIDSSLYVFPSEPGYAAPHRMTQVEWELDLTVAIQFPRFIQALPKSLVQTTGDRLLNQIVRQVSRCLTRKVQEDFHQTRNLAFAKRRKKFPWQHPAESARLEHD